MPKRPTPKSIPPDVLYTMERLIKLLVKGDTLDQIAPKLNMGATDVKGLVLHPEFEAFFERLDKKGYKTWKEALDAKAQREQVKTEATRDAGEYYRKAREIVLSSSELKDKERLDALLKLLSMSDALGEGVTEEIIRLAPASFTSLREVLEETREITH
jgi:hypothetical protein